MCEKQSNICTDWFHTTRIFALTIVVLKVNNFNYLIAATHLQLSLLNTDAFKTDTLVHWSCNDFFNKEIKATLYISATL